mmetsp:Transcript_4805/g.14453  ORF Transcript_4805/g.14453 Transcript_4805/m.14453 type:complete len:301 (+) Transcript_4805:162-1064(+)
MPFGPLDFQRGVARACSQDERRLISPYDATNSSTACAISPPAMASHCAASCGVMPSTCDNCSASGSTDEDATAGAPPAAAAASAAGDTGDCGAIGTAAPLPSAPDTCSAPSVPPLASRPSRDDSSGARVLKWARATARLTSARVVLSVGLGWAPPLSAPLRRGRLPSQPILFICSFVVSEPACCEMASRSLSSISIATRSSFASESGVSHIVTMTNVLVPSRTSRGSASTVRMVGSRVRMHSDSDDSPLRLRRAMVTRAPLKPSPGRPAVVTSFTTSASTILLAPSRKKRRMAWRTCAVV